MTPLRRYLMALLPLLLFNGVELFFNQPRAYSRQPPASSILSQAEINLTGVYRGVVDYPEAGLSGAAILSITGNSFTLQAGQKTRQGKIRAVSWGSMTTVTLVVATETGDKTISARLIRTTDGIEIRSAPGETTVFRFFQCPDDPEECNRIRRCRPFCPR